MVAKIPEPIVSAVMTWLLATSFHVFPRGAIQDGIQSRLRDTILLNQLEARSPLGKFSSDLSHLILLEPGPWISTTYIT